MKTTTPTMPNFYKLDSKVRLKLTLVTVPKTFLYKYTFIVMVMFFTSILYAQNPVLPDANSCTSKDLELVGASLPPPGNDPCACGGTRTLMLTIANKTGSTRTSFALWGTLKIYDSDGIETSTEPIFACAGSIPKTATSTLASSKSITFDCGESLDIIDLFLAWTSASPNETCDKLENNPSLIAPKCGTLPEINIVAGVDADFSVTNATCTVGGSITVFPFGGVPPYKVALGSDERTAIPAGGSTTFTNLSAGSHTFNITDSRPCSSSRSRTVGSSSAPTANAGADFTKTCTANTGGGTIGETAESGFSYSWTSSPAGFTSSAANPSVNPSETTTYTVVKTNDSTGCYDDDSVTVTVDNADVTADAGSDFTKTCTTNTSGGTIGEAASAGFSYSWTSVPVGFTSSDANPSVNPSVTTIYTVVKTNDTSGCNDDDSVTVTVDDTLPDTPSVCIVQPTLCGPATGSITISSPLGTDYEYSIDNGNTWQSSPNFNNLAAGSVTGIKVKNVNTGCISAAVDCDDSDCTPPSGIAETKEILKIEEVLKPMASVKAYPNPFDNTISFKVDSSKESEGSLELVNMFGQKIMTVYNGKIDAGTSTFEVNIPTQKTTTLIYVLRLGEERITGKLIQLKR